jgi:glycyl-tRNA synthetase
LTAIQHNLLNEWRQHFVIQEDMLEIDCTCLTPFEVLQTSGHVDRFADYMVKDSVLGHIFRADHLVKNVLESRLVEHEQLESGKKIKKAKGLQPAVVLSAEQLEEYRTILESLDNYQGAALGELIKRLDIRAPESGNPVTDPVLFNLMFDTQIGPSGDKKGFLRPETAQGHFLNFKRLLEYNNEQMPFASASIGKSFRNEISPRQGLLRVREFTMAEIEHYVHPDRKQHARFPQVKDTVLPLYSKERQLAAEGPISMTIGEAVAKVFCDNQGNC